MKAVFITFDQAHYNKIVNTLDRLSCRGYTAWQQISGRGSTDGEPHYGTHAWPSLASAIITMVPDEKVPSLLARLREFDEESPKLGLRAFVWNICEEGV